MRSKLVKSWLNTSCRLALILGLLGVPFTSWGQDITSSNGLQSIELHNLIADGQFVFGPNVGDFDLKDYLVKDAPHLLPYYDILFYYAHKLSINPRLLLTLIELRSGYVSNPPATDVDGVDLFGLGNSDVEAQLKLISQLLFDAYYQRLYLTGINAASVSQVEQVVLQDDSIIELTPQLNAATNALLRTMAMVSNKGQIISFIDQHGPQSFINSYSRLFPDSNPLDTSNQINIFAVPPDDLLQFPYPRGEEWSFNGAHSPGIRGVSTLSSIDFGPTKPWPRWGNDTRPHWVVAAADSEGVTITSNCGVQIHHRDGWTTTYYHLENIQTDSIKDGVRRNERIANIANTYAEATCKGGHSTSAHVHFTLKRNGAYVLLSGITLSGWRINVNTSVSYSQNCDVMNLSRDDQKKCPYSFIKNEGISSSGSQQDSNRSPSIPSLRDPGDWHVSRDSRAPTLCWNRRGDPDGDRTEYRVEVKGARNATSSWRDRECWRPDELDGNYFNYEWRVNARDSHGSESGWSETRHFTIEEENKSPSIDFQTANGSRDSTIITRETNWTFTGTASDPEGRLQRVEFKCDGDNCGSGDSQSTSGNWTIRRSNMLGKNIVYFRAHDDKQTRDSRKVTLIIDQAAPTSTASVNSNRTPSNGWYRTPVTVRINATDRSTRNARAGIKEIRYRVDNGGERVVAGSVASFSVGSDGAHTVRYYAIDRAGNREVEKSVSFKLDTTAPTPPSGAVAANGAPNDQWQKSHNTPDITWAASTDALSGLFLYELEWRDGDGRIVNQTTRTGNDRQFKHDPVRTGAYQLRGRSRDRAGNVSKWVTMFTLRYDNTAPENPKEAIHGAGIQNDVWQRTTAQADFSWPVPHDEGSGIKGHQLYWGTDPLGTSTTFQSEAIFQNGTQLCQLGETCTGYLRIRSVDNVDNYAEDWSTAFTLRYDDTPPTLDFTFPGDVTQTAQSLVTLQINGADTGSGVKAMRFSHDGVTWTPWEAYADERLWEIPAIGRQSWPIYTQVQDGVGLESSVVRREIYFEVNRPQPRSANYRLFDTIMSAGAGVHSSGGYKGQSTVGQVMDSAHVAGTRYQLLGGYQAGSQAIPLVIPGHDEFLYVNSVFASGVVAQTMQSSVYQMIGTLGEVGLPNNVTTLTSNGYQHQPGFLAAMPALAGAVPLPTPQPGPEPVPEPEPACEFPTVSINAGAVFTGNTNVTLTLCAPFAVEMKVSNDGGFENVQWEPYARTKEWTITTHGETVLPRWVYVLFRDEDGAIHGVYLDDIVYDQRVPAGTLSVGAPWEQEQAQAMFTGLVQASTGNRPDVISVGDQRFIVSTTNDESRLLQMFGSNAEDGVELFLYAQDDNSGIAEMQIGDTPDLATALWEPYSAVKAWSPVAGDGERTVYARFRDTAGNVSDVVENAFVLDATAPTGELRIAQGIVASDALTVALELEAADNLSGVSDMRIGTSEDFSDADWQPYESEIVWPLYLAPEQQDGAIYVQYRDAAGNISATYSDIYLVDRMPPIVFVEVQPGETLTRQLDVLAYDELSPLETMSISNDPFMLEGVVTQSFTDTIEWIFDERRVVWVQVEDSHGNVSEPYPAYAAELDESSPPQVREPTVTIGGVNSGSPGSHFVIVGTGFAPDQTVTLTVNGAGFGFARTDASGSFDVVVTTEGLSPGLYTVAVAGFNVAVSFTLDPAAPVQQEGDDDAPRIALPVDSAPNDKHIFLPWVAR